MNSYIFTISFSDQIISDHKRVEGKGDTLFLNLKKALYTTPLKILYEET